MPNRILSFLISNCTAEEFTLVKKYIAEFCLDDNDLKAEQFLVAKRDDKVIGFGRLRNYETCNELCSLGVIEEHRMQGAGTAICKALIQKSKTTLYTVTIIPEFFQKFHFNIVQEFPSEVARKLHYCTSDLQVPETYVVMRLF